MTAILLVILALAVPALVIAMNGQGKKRGCGRGCATCGNRFICHPEDYKREDEKP